MPVTDLVMRKINVQSGKGMLIRDARAVQMKDVHFLAAEGESLTIDHAEVRMSE